jgi:FlaG/FlaF family flagellin (archaellin)
MGVGTILLVVIAVALIGVIGVFIFGLVSFPEEPPEVDVAYTKVNDRWAIHVNSAIGETPLNEFRVIARHSDGTIVSYDSDGDTAPDSLLALDLEDVVVASGDGVQTSPMVYIDTDEDGTIGPGDSFVAYRSFIPSVFPLMDATRGYHMVGNEPNELPIDSTLAVLVTPTTMGTDDINPGDAVYIEVKKGSTVWYNTTGTFSSTSTFMTKVHVDPSWQMAGGYKTTITVRPGEVDEWSGVYNFKVIEEDPLTPQEVEYYASVSTPLRVTDRISIIHEPSNTVILEFTL